MIQEQITLETLNAKLDLILVKISDLTDRITALESNKQSSIPSTIINPTTTTTMPIQTTIQPTIQIQKQIPTEVPKTNTTTTTSISMPTETQEATLASEVPTETTLSTNSSSIPRQTKPIPINIAINDTIDPELAPIPLTTPDETRMIIDDVIKTKVELKLIYHPKQSEDTSANVSSICCGKAPLLIIIRSKDGFRFGGYTAAGFDKVFANQEIHKDDNEACIFSLDKKVVYPFKKVNFNSQALFCSNKCLFNFRGGFHLVDHFLTNNNNGNNMVYYEPHNNKHELNGGKEYYAVKDLFVYYVYFK